MKELKGAFHSIANNKEMTLMQETAMETVWHEFLHCHSKAWRNGRVSSAVPLMETLNEFMHDRPTISLLQNLEEGLRIIRR